MTLPKTEMMNRRDDDDGSTPAIDKTNSFQSKVWERRIALVCIVVASFGLLVCAGLLVQAFITHKPAFELLGSYSLVSSIIGFLILIICFNILILANTNQKKLNYVSAFISSVLEALKYSIW